MAPNICEFLVWSLLLVTLLAPRGFEVVAGFLLRPYNEPLELRMSCWTHYKLPHALFVSQKSNLGTVPHNTEDIIASHFHLLITGVIFYVCCLVLYVCFLFCVFCVCVCFFFVFCVLFLLLYIVVSFLFLYKFADLCHRAETQLQ